MAIVAIDAIFDPDYLMKRLDLRIAASEADLVEMMNLRCTN